MEAIRKTYLLWPNDFSECSEFGWPAIFRISQQGSGKCDRLLKDPASWY